MEQWLKEYPGQIELVVSNNDDMALGAIDAMNRAGIGANSIKVVGIDGTPVGIKALEEGIFSAQWNQIRNATPRPYLTLPGVCHWARTQRTGCRSWREIITGVPSGR